MRKPYVALLSALVTVALADRACAIAIPANDRLDALRIVALSNEQAPGLPTGVRFGSRGGGSGLFAPVLNDRGQVAFSSRLVGSDINDTNENAIWKENEGALTLLARQGDAAFTPDNGLRLQFPGSPLVNDVGDVAYWFSLTGIGVVPSNDLGLWITHSGQRQLAAREGAPAPGAPPGSTYFREEGLKDSRVLNQAGDLAFYSELQIPGSSSSFTPGLWVTRAGQVVNLAYDGSPAAGMAPGVSFTSFSYPALNRHGHVAFAGGLSGPGVTTDNNEAIWGNFGSDNALLAREGNLTLIDDTLRFGLFTTSPKINALGQVLFANELENASSTQDDSLWVASGSQLRLVAREGSQAPGATAGVTLSDNSFQFPVINDRGSVAFSGGLQGAGVTGFNDTGIWLDREGRTELIIREGDQIPGLPSGTVLGHVFAQRLMLNAYGQLAFLAEIRNPDATNGRAVLATTADGLLRTLLRNGDLIDLGPQGLQPITNIHLFDDTGNGDGLPSSFNDLGQLAVLFHVGSGNSGGIAVSSLVYVPEPGGAMVASVAIVAMTRRRVPHRRPLSHV
jgi:hypothetical protein